MEQRNIRKRKTIRRRLIAVLFFVLALILASLRSGALVYALLYMSVLLPVLSALYTLYVYHRISIAQLIDNHFAVKNEPVEYTCVLANDTSSAFTEVKLQPLSDLSEILDFDREQTFCLAPGERAEMHSPVICRRRGVYTIGIERILISDILGLMTFSFKPPVEFRVTVYPRVLHIDSLGLFELEGSRAKRGRGISEKEPADTVRDYEKGDDPRLIHWKATARTGELKVRQLAEIEKPAMQIIVDTKRYADDSAQIIREDNLLETLLSICDYCVVQGIPADVYVQNETFSVRSFRDFSELYDWSCRMVFSSDNKEIAVPKVTASCCAFLTTGRNMSAVMALEAEASSGVDCVLMEFGQDDPYIPADSSGLKVVSVSNECRIEQMLA